MSHWGTATWFSLCDGTNGAGAGYGCPCDDDEHHIAYAPAPQTNCIISYGYGCNGYLNDHYYCDTVWIYSDCSSTWLNTSVRTCPCFDLPPNHSGECQYTCWVESNDCSPTWAYKLADLTTASFMALGFSLGVGIIYVEVND